ncbi:oxidoreductase [Pseudoclavibacter chungangensis]|uniref:Oxidoreductase n=1 Tax=Pseudoclavibacter chungangensis TaxID=587635 RepID=A0A7J5BMS9_9MICO|nr:FAD-dependent oxidoreductase [Pseudoclavibacter chungangensis]KAB1652853.1 oxidoreductase [Pseudoclavibacter chungangensis]NYJ67151.1 NADPH-dependent 2,4-dienoyl-CoA reductase/sulfur reductase-like enzyme [Pseudoclavibacter chungangensis]
MDTPERIVVVGGGLAAYTLGDALRSLGHRGEVVVIEKEPAMYDRPPLSKAAFAGDIALDGLAFASGGKLDALGLRLLSGRTVVGIDPDAGAVTLDDGTVVEGDAVVLATGGSARRLALPGSDLPVVHVLRTFADALAIRAAAVPGARILVAGAGLIGAELTASLRSRGVEVTLIDNVEVPLVPAVGQPLAERLHAMHAAHGVDVRVATISSLEAARHGWSAELSDGTALRIDAVVVGTGIVPNVELAEAAGLDVDNGILVDRDHRTSHPRVHAIGDVARTRSTDGTLHRREEHWEAARLDALELAAVLVGQAPAPRGAGWWWSDRYDVHVEGVGRMTGDGTAVFRGEDVAFHLEGRLLVGAVSVNDPHAVRAARRLIDQRIPVEAAELADPTLPLRELLRSARPAYAGR